jgi:hypothetical protein
MRRSVQISVALLAVLVLIGPFDCFAGGFTRKAAACCVKGKCLPTSNADECCKGTTPLSKQFSAPKSSDQSAPVQAIMATAMPGPIAPAFVAFRIDEAHAPSSSPLSSRLNLPLLI